MAKKFLEMVTLKKLTSQCSALKAKTNEFAIVPSHLDVAQLSKLLERHDAVLIEQRTENGKDIDKLWVGRAIDTFKLMK